MHGFVHSAASKRKSELELVFKLPTSVSSDPFYSSFNFTFQDSNNLFVAWHVLSCCWFYMSLFYQIWKYIDSTSASRHHKSNNTTTVHSTISSHQIKFWLKMCLLDDMFSAPVAPFIVRKGFIYPRCYSVQGLFQTIDTR